MTDKAKTEKSIPSVLTQDSTQVTLGGATFNVARGSSDVKTYNGVLPRSKAPSRRAPKDVTNQSIIPNEDLTEAQVFGATLEVHDNEKPLIETTGVIKPQRGPAPVVKAPVAAASRNKKGSAPLAEILVPKTTFAVGEDTGDGWICVSKRSRLSRIFGGVKPVEVVKFVGDVTYPDLAEAAKAEELKKTVSDIRVPAEGEVLSAFNTVASLAGKAQAVWIEAPAASSLNIGATAVSLAEQDKKKALRTPRAGGNKNAGVLFGTLKLA